VVARWQVRNERQWNYASNKDWRSVLGVTDGDHDHEKVWRSVLATLERRGIRAGPESFLGWNDGDPALIDAIWCLLRRLKPNKIVETGVANGVTSRFILEWCAKNNKNARLWSIDLPPLDQQVARQIGAAVINRSQWTFIEGSSRRRLPRLLKQIAPIDLFIHDSDHRQYNMAFEMRLAWQALRGGGALVVDDIDVNAAFHEFTDGIAGGVIIGEAEPIRPDRRRFNEKGLFGIVLKPA
jgi:predicted O-methyltransferase YrrM